MEILVAGNDPGYINMMRAELEKLECKVEVSLQSRDALKKLNQASYIGLVVVDEFLEDIEGKEFCKRLRLEITQRPLYIILLKGKSQRTELLEGFDFVADDYLNKPFNLEELEVRIRAGTKIIQLNKKLRATEEVKQISLKSGREAQESLLPVNFPDIPGMEIAARFLPSAFVSGDIYNIFRLDENNVGLYNIDVSGHGVPAALFSVGLNQRLTHDLHSMGLLKIPSKKPPYYWISPPDKVISVLDEDDMLGRYGRYFTMVYAIVHLDTNCVSFCRAGHNLPLMIHADGSAEYLDGGGPPIGLGLSKEKRIREKVQLSAGDEFILFSDGINESYSQKGDAEYGLLRVKAILSEHNAEPLGQSFDILIKDAKKHHGGKEFSDDISIIGFKWER